MLSCYGYSHPCILCDRLIDLARAEPVAVAKHGRPVVVVMAVEKYERLKCFKTGHVDSRPSTTGKAE